MRGVLLLGGSGSRLEPLNRVCNKHLINVGGKPMAQWNVEKFVEVGITEILIITGKEHMGSIINYFGDGMDFGCNITYKVQSTADGIAGALRLTKGYINTNEFFFVILGDNIFEDPLPIGLVKEHTQIILTYKSVEDPERFGVLSIDGSIIEKPQHPETNFAVCGIYGYRNSSLFTHILNNLPKSERGEYEVTDINNLMITNNFDDMVEKQEFGGYWTDAGTHTSLQKANEYKYNEQ